MFVCACVFKPQCHNDICSEAYIVVVLCVCVCLSVCTRFLVLDRC